MNKIITAGIPNTGVMREIASGLPLGVASVDENILRDPVVDVLSVTYDDGFFTAQIRVRTFFTQEQLQDEVARIDMVVNGETLHADIVSNTTVFEWVYYVNPETPIDTFKFAGHCTAYVIDGEQSNDVEFYVSLFETVTVGTPTVTGDGTTLVTVTTGAVVVPEGLPSPSSVVLRIYDGSEYTDYPSPQVLTADVDKTFLVSTVAVFETEDPSGVKRVSALVEVSVTASSMSDITEQVAALDNAVFGDGDNKGLVGRVDDLENTTLQRILFMEASFGKYDAIRDITLSQGKSGKYVNVDGTETSAAGYGISNAVELNFGDILLVPSAEAVPASVSVVARVVTRTYAKVITYTYTYQQEDPTLYDTATADYDPTLVYTAVYDTSGETPVLTGWTIGGETIETLPATHEVTESYYEPLVKQAVSAMPSTGYYVYLCPSAMTVVISGYTATVDGGVCKVVGWGIFKNIVSNFIGAPGQSVLAQLLCDLDARVKGIMARLENLGEVKAITIDSENLPMVCGQSLVVEGAGAPSVVPQFVGQRYHDTTNSKCYEAFAVTGATSNWKLLN